MIAMHLHQDLSWQTTDTTSDLLHRPPLPLPISLRPLLHLNIDLVLQSGNAIPGIIIRLARRGTARRAVIRIQPARARLRVCLSACGEGMVRERVRVRRAGARWSRSESGQSGLGESGRWIRWVVCEWGRRRVSSAMQVCRSVGSLANARACAIGACCTISSYTHSCRSRR